MAVRFVLSIAGIFYRALQLLPFADKIVSLNTLSCRKCTLLTTKWRAERTRCFSLNSVFGLGTTAKGSEMENRA